MKTFVVYPGRFHPWHLGHKSVYDFLISKYGKDNVYITSTNIQNPENSPFSFNEKKIMIEATGISGDKIIEVKQNYNYKEIEKRIPINMDVDYLFFATSFKDMTKNPRFTGFVKKDGSPTYLQMPPENKNDMMPAFQHGYLIEVPTAKFKVLGKKLDSASKLRILYTRVNDNQRKQMIQDLYGQFLPDIYNIMNNKLLKSTIKEELKKHINSILEDEDVWSKKIKGYEIKRDQYDLMAKKTAEDKAEDTLKNAIESLKTAKQNKKEDTKSEETTIISAKQNLMSAKKSTDAANKKLTATKS